MHHLQRLLACATITFLTACSSGLGNTELPDPDTGESAGTVELGLGFDPGVALAQPIAPRAALAAARIEGTAATRDIIFLAFATASPADDADGANTPLVRGATVPADANGSLDVFLVALEDDLVDTGDTGLLPAAFSRSLVNTFRHSRCVHCHGVGSVTPEGEEEIFPVSHPGPPPVIEIETCTTCHSGALVPDLEGVEWRAPLDDNGDFDFRGKTVEQLNQMAQAFDVDEHLRVDTRIRWAIESGNVPLQAPIPGGSAGTSGQWAGSGRDVGAVPISYATFLAEVDAWVAGGFQATAAGSVRDLVLVSQIAGAGSPTTGDGDSFAPAITYVPNPAYFPDSGLAAGTVHVAFASDATNLTGDTSANRDIIRASVEVFVDRDVNGAAETGGLDLAFDTASPTLVSVAAGGGTGGDADSDAPVIDGTGALVAFETAASNLVAGFIDSDPAGRDVFLRDLTGGVTHLVSVSTTGVGQGGTGDSANPAISPTGGFVAFESTAADLVADDTNAVQDIFTARFDAGAVEAPVRASLTSTGAEGTGGASRNATLQFDGTTVSVAFESDKTNLTAEANGGFSQVFLRENDTTQLLSQLKTGGAAAPGNGDSRSPFVSPTGGCVLFESEATNLDFLSGSDTNGVADILLVDLAALRTSDEVLARRLSLASSGEDGKAAANEPRITSFRDGDGVFNDSVALFRTSAENLGASGSDLVTIALAREDVTALTDFNATPLVGPAPHEVMFTNLSTGDVTAFAWSFDANDADATSTLEDPTFTFATPGTYTVALTVTREAGQETETKEDLVRVLTPIAAAFTVSPATTGIEPFNVTFTDASTGDLDEATYSWDFDDGATSTEQNPTHTFTAAGAYDVVQTVTGLAGTDSSTQTITVTVPTGANFTADVQSGFADLTVTFTNASVGTPNTFTWDFGDGVGASTDENPTYTYTTRGTFDVTLSIDGPDGPSAQTKTDFIDVRTFADDVVPLFGSNGCTVCHPASGNLDLSGTPAVIHLDLLGAGGTGAPSEGAQCPGTFRVLPGNPTDSLLKQVVDPSVTACNDIEAMGNFNSADLAMLVLWIEDGAKKGDAVLTPIDAAFTVSPGSTGIEPFNVTFTDTSTGDLVDATYSWDFDDGGTSIVQSPTHTFSTAGTYDVVQTVTGPAGMDSSTQTITVNAPTGANFTADVQSGFADLTVTFTNTSIGSPNTFSWDFGDGVGTSTDENPTYTYTTRDTFDVTLNVDGPGGPSSQTKMDFIDVRTFTDDIVPLFAANSCTSCHPASGGLTLTGTPAAIHLELLGGGGTGAPSEGAQCGGTFRVLPGDPTNSLLKQVVDPMVSACNDSQGMGNFNTVDLALLVLWIQDGAKD